MSFIQDTNLVTEEVLRGVSWFLLRQVREKPLEATVCSGFPSRMIGVSFICLLAALVQRWPKLKRKIAELVEHDTVFQTSIRFLTGMMRSKARL